MLSRKWLNINDFSFTFKYDQIPPEFRLQFFRLFFNQKTVKLCLLGFLFLYNLHPETQQNNSRASDPDCDVRGKWLPCEYDVSPTYLQQVTPGAVHIQTSS